MTVDPIAGGGRRHFLRLMAASWPGLQFGGAETSGSRKPLRGIFPIMQTPFTQAGGVDTESLRREAVFLDRCRVHGMVWPQFASEYASLSYEERIAGMELIASAGKRLAPAVVLGVQAGDVETATKYAKHAARVGADAVVALPPTGETSQDRILDYYRRIGEASPLPLFAQTIGNMSVEFVLKMAERIPTFRYVKDEAGQTLPRLSQFAKSGSLNAFTGAHGKTLLDELERGSAGSMPAASFADLYVAAWNAWNRGDRKRAAAMFAKTSLLVAEVQVYGIESLKYILHLRGVFPTYHMRGSGGVTPPASTGLEPGAPLDETGKKLIRELIEFVKPDLQTALMRSHYRRSEVAI